nr:MAG TPA: hypothetical protein [Caudoviricetes sp.]
MGQMVSVDGMAAAIMEGLMEYAKEDPHKREIHR